MIDEQKMKEAEVYRLSSSWLTRKIDRDRRMAEFRKYIDEYIPELKSSPMSTLLDIGPGPGELLELAMAHGMNAIGWDAETPEGGMGSEYLTYSRMCHEARGIEVKYGNDFRAIGHQAAKIINMRGSIEQVLAPCLNGEPHHLHQDCRKLSWDPERGLNGLTELLNTLRASLVRGGFLMIAANGAANTDWYTRTLHDIYQDCRFARIQQFDERTHKLYA